MFFGWFNFFNFSIILEERSMDYVPGKIAKKTKKEPYFDCKNYINNCVYLDMKGTRPKSAFVAD